MEYSLGVKQRRKVGYGWTRDIPDHRDFKFSNRKVEAPIILPTVTSLRRKMPSYIFDQGQLGSCFIGETLVPLLNGNTRSLKELAEGVEGKEFWVYSQNDYGYMVAAKATASKTGLNRRLVEVKLDNGESIICTPDHQFMNRDGEYVEAKDLQPKESLMPFKKDVNKFGYEMVWDNAKQCWDMTHWMAKTTFKSPPIFKNSYPVIHHKDFNKRNNEPTNLKYMEKYSHIRLHSEHAKVHGFGDWNGSEEQREHSRGLMYSLHESQPERMKEISSIGGTIAWQKARENPDMEARMLSGLKKKALKLGKTLGRANSNKFQAMKLGREVLDEGLKLNEGNWNKIRDTYTELKIHGRSEKEIKYNCKPKYQTALKQFQNEAEFKEACANYNCKVISVTKLKRREDVYCLTVPEYENFALESGVFVHNCTANSSCMAWDFIHRTGPYSRLQEYYNTRYVEGTVSQDSGGQIRDAIKCLANCGVAQETLWPYDVNQFTVAPPANVVTSGKQDEITTYMSIAQGREMRECLAEGFPFVAGFTVFDQFESDTCAQTGIVAMPNASANPVGGHAVCVIGYDFDFHTNPVFLNSHIPAHYVSNEMYEVRNSWGESWGDRGHFWIPAQYLENSNLASDFWTIRR